MRMPSSGGKRARALRPAEAARRRAVAAPPAPTGSASTRRFDQCRRGSTRKPLRGLAVDGPPVAPENHRTDAKAGEDHAPPSLRGLRTAVLREEAKVPADLLAEEHRRLTAPGRTADVDDLRLGVEQRPPLRLARPVRPVGLLAEQEERLVERPDVLERLTPNQERGGLGELDLPDLVVPEPPAVEGVEDP